MKYNKIKQEISLVKDNKSKKQQLSYLESKQMTKILEKKYKTFNSYYRSSDKSIRLKRIEKQTEGQFADKK